MSESNRSEKTDTARREIREALKSLRVEVHRVGKDLQSIVDSTQKFVETMTPVVSATLEDSMDRASEAFKRTMNTVDHQTRPQQAKILQNYKSLLERQLASVERRISEISEKK